MPIPEASVFSIVVNITQKSGGNLSNRWQSFDGAQRPQEDEGEDSGDVAGGQGLGGLIGSPSVRRRRRVYFIRPKYIMLLFITSTGKIHRRLLPAMDAHRHFDHAQDDQLRHLTLFVVASVGPRGLEG